MPGLSSTGFETKTLETIKSEIEADEKAAISPALNVEADTSLGQLNGIVSSKLAEVWELAQAVWAAGDPDMASGFQLTALAALTGTTREPATRTSVEATVNIDDGTSFAPGDLVAHIAGDPTARFVNVDSVSNSTGSAADFTITFQAENTGPVRADAGTLTVIAEAKVGWNTVTNAADHTTLGSEEETDAELRLRRERELAADGSATVEAIKTDVLRVANVEQVLVLQNFTEATVDGIPTKSVETIVKGGTDADVAAAIFGSVAGGIRPYGSSSATVTDSMGQDHSIGFTRPTTRNVYLEFDLDVDPDDYVGDTVVKQTVADWGDTNLTMGVDVIVARLIQLVMALGGVEDVTAVRLGFSASPVGTSNLAIALRELADFDTGRIVVNS